MLTGDKSTFAIECEMCAASDSFVYCSFRCWIADEPIGDWDEEVALGVLIHSATVIMRYQNKRHLAQADSLTAEALWRNIDQFVNSENPVDLRVGLEGRYRQRFLLHQLADDSVATVCEVIVAERTNGLQRLLWKCIDSNEIREITLPELSIDRTIAKFLQWAESTTSTGA